MQEIETIRNLISEQIEASNCLDTTGCQEHKRHFGILTDALTALNQLEAKLNKPIDIERVILHLNNALSGLNLDRNDISKLQGGAILSCSINSQRMIGDQIKKAIAEIKRQQGEL